MTRKRSCIWCIAASIRGSTNSACNEVGFHAVCAFAHAATSLHPRHCLHEGTKNWPPSIAYTWTSWALLSWSIVSLCGSALQCCIRGRWQLLMGEGKFGSLPSSTVLIHSHLVILKSKKVWCVKWPSRHMLMAEWAESLAVVGATSCGCYQLSSNAPLNWKPISELREPKGTRNAIVKRNNTSLDYEKHFNLERLKGLWSQTR